MTTPQKPKNGRVVALALGMVLAMTGLTAASVPLYRLFCQVTGYGGTPNIDAEATSEVGERLITVRFNADVNSALPWEFKAGEREITLHVGEQRLTYYQARNTSDQPILGQATFNVTPAKAAPYFTKIACFCFNEQRLEAGQQTDMPVTFFVDPAINDDPNTQDVKTITLSYTFFRAKNEGSGT